MALLIPEPTGLRAVGMAHSPADSLLFVPGALRLTYSRLAHRGGAIPQIACFPSRRQPAARRRLVVGDGAENTADLWGKQATYPRNTYALGATILCKC